MSDRVCVRGCVQRDVHYATCDQDGCKGCAPRECRDGSLICDRCFGRARALLSDASDLLARLRSIGDPSKATPTDQVRVRGGSTELPAPIGADLLDAIRTVEAAAHAWRYWLADLAAASNDLESVQWLSDYVLDRHHDVDGIRLGWSVQDAVDRWGVERRDKNPLTVEDELERDVVVTPVPEWPRPLMTRDEAVDFAGSVRTLQRWVKDGTVTPVRPEVAGVALVFYRPAELDAARDAARASQGGSTKFAAHMGGGSDGSRA